MIYTHNHSGFCYDSETQRLTLQTSNRTDWIEVSPNEVDKIAERLELGELWHDVYQSI
jgi:hypothetical protein